MGIDSWSTSRWTQTVLSVHRRHLLLSSHQRPSLLGSVPSNFPAEERYQQTKGNQGTRVEQAKGSSTHLSRRQTGFRAEDNIVDFRNGCTKPSGTIMHCMWLGRFNGLKKGEGKGK